MELIIKFAAAINKKVHSAHITFEMIYSLVSFAPFIYCVQQRKYIHQETFYVTGTQQ